MSTIDFSKFAIQAVEQITWIGISNNDILAVLSEPKDCNIEVGGDTVYASGGKGNPKLVSFGHSKMVSLKANNAVYETGALANSFGSATPLVGATSGAYKTEVLTVSATNTITTTYTPVIRADDTYVSYARKQYANGGLGDRYVEDSVAATGKFSVSGQTITFDASDVDEGDKIVVCYNYLAGSTTSTLKVQSDKFANTVKCIIDVYVKDMCNDDEYAAQFIIPKLKLMEEVSFALNNSGDPAIFNISGESLKPCNSTDLLDFKIIDEDGAV